MTTEAELDEELLDDEPVVDDLTDVALANPVVHKRLDLSRINVLELLSLGDIADMARELGTSPDRLTDVLKRGDKVGLEVAIVLAWIVGRKRDADLDIGTVRRFWQVELVGIGTAKPNPTPARTKRTPRSSERLGSSRTRG